MFVASGKTLPLALTVLAILPPGVGDKGLIALCAPPPLAPRPALPLSATLSTLSSTDTVLAGVMNSFARDG